MSLKVNLDRRFLSQLNYTSWPLFVVNVKRRQNRNEEWLSDFSFYATLSWLVKLWETFNLLFFFIFGKSVLDSKKKIDRLKQLFGLIGCWNFRWKWLLIFFLEVFCQGFAVMKVWYYILGFWWIEINRQI